MAARIAVYQDPKASKPSYPMWLVWTNGEISLIREYRYVRYVIDEAELALASNITLPGEETADG